MNVTVSVPDYFAMQFRLDAPVRTRQLLMGFLRDCYAGGELTAGEVAKVLGLSFHETEEFLHAHSAPGL
jgi:hypothetical protein